MTGNYFSPLGNIVFHVEDGHLTSLFFGPHTAEDNSPLIQSVQESLRMYFNKEITSFHLPISLKGTAFQKRVWTLLLEIPYGTTQSYQEIAIGLGMPKAAQAVGQACKKNPIGILIPCHRVIGKNGDMVGYSGKEFIDLKRQLLKHEKNEVFN